MRNLTSIRSADLYLVDLQLSLLSRDRGTTWVFSQDDILSIDAIEWEGPFMGGMAKTSRYGITLSSSLSFIKSILPQAISGLSTLRVTVNSDTFYPHVGRVRAISRDVLDPNQFTLDIYDRFQDAVPQVPTVAIADSHSMANAAVLDSNMGYPLYYGDHHRRFYHTAIDCNAKTLLGPLNVSSANHVNSVFYQNSLTNHVWAQQSGSTNQVSGATGLTTSAGLYENYDVFSPVTNSADIAISNNPFGILAHIFSHHTGTPFVLAQNTQAQADVSSYRFCCFFGERQPLDEIIDEFGRITATNVWMGDSGMLNFRTYQESASAVINATITTSDVFTIKILENPLGSTKFDTEKYKRIQVSYSYDFKQQRYDRNVQANPSNNAFCNSAQASGIDKDSKVNVRHIMHSDTASYYLGNLIRKNTQSEEFVLMNLPAKFFQLEIADVVKIQNPVLVGSQALYQITQISHDYARGLVGVQCEKLLSL